MSRECAIRPGMPPAAAEPIVLSTLQQIHEIARFPRLGSLRRIFPSQSAGTAGTPGTAGPGQGSRCIIMITVVGHDLSLRCALCSGAGCGPLVLQTQFVCVRRPDSRILALPELPHARVGCGPVRAIVLMAEKLKSCHLAFGSARQPEAKFAPPAAVSFLDVFTVTVIILEDDVVLTRIGPRPAVLLVIGRGLAKLFRLNVAFWHAPRGRAGGRVLSPH
jgi:hypothetical protein